MKKLFSRAKKDAWEGYEESEYCWDGVSEEPMDGAEENLWEEEESCGPEEGERLKETEYGEEEELSAECVEEESEYYDGLEASAEYMEGESEYYDGLEASAEYMEGESEYYDGLELSAEYAERESGYCDGSELCAEYYEEPESLAESVEDSGELESYVEYTEETDYCQGPETYTEYAGEEIEYCEEPEAFPEYQREEKYHKASKSSIEYGEEAGYDEEPEFNEEREFFAEYSGERESFAEYAEESEYSEGTETFAEYAERAEYGEVPQNAAEYAEESEYSEAQELSGEYFGEDGQYYGTDDSTEMFGEDSGRYEAQETAGEYVGGMTYCESEIPLEEYGEESVQESAAGKAYQERSAYEEDAAYLEMPPGSAGRQAVRNTGRNFDRQTSQDTERGIDYRTAATQNSGRGLDHRTAATQNSGRGLSHRTAASRNSGGIPSRRTTKNAGRQSQKGISAKIGQFFHNMDILDKVMLASGAAVLILAVVIVSIFVRAHGNRSQLADFANVGVQLEGIHMIGEKGIAAVANAEAARLAALAVPTAPPSVPSDPNKDYGEIGYSRQVSVEPRFTSIQKDLKIKFINIKSDKLVPNVPFSVTVTAPDGRTYIWSDDDMDGIIYKQDIAPGNYQVAMELLADARYSDYTVSTSGRSVEVKKEIVYEKVDVANEVKKETEVNAAEEDTKKNETVVESSLQDTVAWVESKVIAAAYNEVAKSSIPDPLTIVDRGRFLPTGQVELLAQSSVEAWAEVSAPTPIPVKGTVTVEQTALSGGTGGSLKTKASVGGFAENARIIYSIRTNNPAVATASIDPEGNIEVYAVAVGTAVLTVTANYEGGTAETQAAVDITVTIGGIMALTLDTTSLATHVEESVVVNASISNMISQDPVVTAESSDTNIAVVSVDKKAVTVTGISEGIAVITVKYSENGTTVGASCKVTVKRNPKQDNQTPLKDAEGRQLYVMEGSAYREAVYADYYTAQKFFIKRDAKYTGWQTLDGNVYYFTADGSKVTGEQVIQGAKYNFASDGSLVTGDGELGIDVSKWNGTIDWNAVKNSGVSYVIIRCGYRGSSAGKLIEDPKFDANIKGATAAGLKAGVYFFTQAINEIEAVEEASMVLEQIKDYKISYPVFLDVEASGGRGDAIDRETRTAVCRAFCQTIQSAGYNAGIYSGRLWLEEKIDASSLSMYKIWLAQYAAEPTYTGRYDMWQYKSTGSVSGVSGNVDLNISYLGY